MAEGKKNRKVDRNRKGAQNLAYKGEKRHIKSHIARLTKALEANPHDKMAREALKRYEAMR
jgi:hypothetical protein